MTRKSNLCHHSLSPLFILGLFSELLNGSTPLVLSRMPLLGHDEPRTPFYTFLSEQKEEQNDCPHLFS